MKISLWAAAAILILSVAAIYAEDAASADNGFFQFLSEAPLKAEIKNSHLMTGHLSRAGHVAETDGGRG